jgi:ParB/Sulfiredoxin domain
MQLFGDRSTVSLRYRRRIRSAALIRPIVSVVKFSCLVGQHAILSLDHYETRDFRGRRYLRAGQSPGHARAKARGRIAASMLDIGQQTPILVRADGARFVLVEGLHRLEAAKALGEKTIIGFRVEERKH